MAKNDNDLIGYDPLAWMDEETEDPNEQEIAALLRLNQQGDLDADSVEEGEGIGSDATVSAMAQHDDADDGSSPVHLDANLSIQHIVKWHEQFKKVLATNDVIEINAADVASVDTAALQLCVALKKDALKQHKTVIFSSPSPRFIESAKLLGLRETLDV